MPDDGWRLLFETEREILRRRLRGWLGRRRRRELREPGPDRIEQETLRARLPRRRRSFRRHLSPALGMCISGVVHLVLLAIFLPSLVQEPPTAEEHDPLVIRWVAREAPKPEPVEAPPVEAPEPPPETPTPETVREDIPEDVLEKPVPAVTVEEPTPPEPAGAEDGDASAPDLAAAEEPSPRGLGPGASRIGRSPLGARSGERVVALRIYGGGAETEEAVRLGIEWLARHQDPDGSWDPHGYTRHCRPGLSCTGTGFPEYRAGVTGLALLAFLGAGLDHQHDSPFRENVAGAVEWLLAHQDERGCFGPREGQYLYNHGIATIAVAEAAALTRDDALVAATGRAIRFIERTQQAGGGWDYTSARTNRNDLSVSGWQVMALHSAAAAGVPARTATLTRLEDYLRRAVRRDGSAIYADRGTGEGRGGVSIASVGLLSKLYAGWSPRSPETQRAAVRLVRQGPDPDGRADWERTYQSLYYWYTATLALFHVGGEQWEAWNLYLQRTVLPLQHRDGEREGSWDPDPNWIGAAGGRVMSTALGVLTFEVYYRYTPLYRKLGLSPTPGRESAGEPR